MGIYSGIFSPTQAAAVAVFYCLALAVFIYRDFNFADFTGALMATVKLSSMIYFLVIGGELFGKVLGYIGLPQMISEMVIGMDFGPTTTEEDCCGQILFQGRRETIATVATFVQAGSTEVYTYGRAISEQVKVQAQIRLLRIDARSLTTSIAKLINNRVLNSQQRVA